MITLFRRFRKRLLSENKFSKYLIYAIGEIILVVVGILIALQINNTNNFNGQRKLEQEYLTSLQSEFKTNLTKINTSIQENEQRALTLAKLLDLFDTKVLDTVSEQAVSHLFAPIFGSNIEYTPTTGVLSDIISSGKLSLILNKDLRQHLASFNSRLDLLSSQLNEVEFTDKKLQSLFFKTGSVRNIVMDIKRIDFEHQSISVKTNNKLIFDSVEFENYLLDYFLTAKATNGPRLLVV